MQFHKRRLITYLEKNVTSIHAVNFNSSNIILMGNWNYSIPCILMFNMLDLAADTLACFKYNTIGY